MLKQFSRLEKTRSAVIIVFALLMGISLVIFYAPTRNSATASPATSTEVLAEVNGDNVTVADLTLLKESYKQRFGGQISLAQLGGDKRFLDGLIRNRIVLQEANRLGVAPSDAEVAEAIRKNFTDASGTFIGFDKYKAAVVANYGSIERYEQQVRDAVAAEKLRSFITAGVQVAGAEVEDDYKRTNASFDLVYVPVTPDKLASRMSLSDEELRKFYDERKTDFRILETQKKFRYLFIDQEKMGSKLQIADEELRAEYNNLAPENKIGGVNIQQVVLKVARPDLDTEVHGKADRLIAEARSKGDSISEEDFAQIARGNSEDPATARDGGRVPNPVRRNPNNPKDIYQNVFNLKEGEVSDSFFTNNAYYFFRRGKAVEKTFEDARPELLVSLRNRKAYGLAAQLAARAAERLKATKNPEVVAGELAAEANMNPADMVRETPFIKPGDDVPGIGSSPQFEQAVEPLNNQGDIGERTSIKGGFAIPVLVEKRDPRIPEFDEVKDKVTERARVERATSQLERAARELAASAASAADLKAAAERLGLAAQTSEAYKLSSPLGEAGTSPAADAAIFNLKAGEVTKTPIKIGDRWVVVGATKRTDADMAEFGKQRDELTRTALSSRRDQVFEDYITSTRKRLEADGKIKVYDDVLASIVDDEEPSLIPPTAR